LSTLDEYITAYKNLNNYWNENTTTIEKINTELKILVNENETLKKLISEGNKFKKKRNELEYNGKFKKAEFDAELTKYLVFSGVIVLLCIM
jgi:hypothetical protein